MEGVFFTSIESRWFVPGKIHSGWLDWFTSSPLCREFPIRDDLYLDFPETLTAGIKFREGRFEIKLLSGNAGTLSWPQEPDIPVERWVKWSAPLHELFPQGSSMQQWISVTKKRWLRKFIVEGQELAEVEPENKFESGCQVEISEIRCRAIDFWSFNLEAFGPDCYSILQQVWEKLRNSLDSSDLSFVNDLNEDTRRSYPVWLNSFTS